MRGARAAIFYPLLPTTAPSHEYGELIGESRNRILADLATPRTTAEAGMRSAMELVA